MNKILIIITNTLFILNSIAIAYCTQPEILIDYDKLNTLNAIKIRYNNTEFFPSNVGGVSVITSKGEVYNPWSNDVKFQLVKKQNTYSEIYTEWVMYINNYFYYHYELSIEGKNENLTIHIKDLGKIPGYDISSEYADVYAVNLDRCEDAKNPIIVSVPYLTTFNILFANDCFVSMFFDWDKTNSSQLITYNVGAYSQTSEYYSQFCIYNKLTNNKRNTLDETIYLRVSDNIDNVFPELHNPISKYKKESSERIVFDDWNPFNLSILSLTEIDKVGIKNIWHILHNWQNFGYDVALPDVLPANHLYGGNYELIRISEYDRTHGNLIALHENYIDIFTASSKFNPEYLALNSSGKYIFNWFNGDTSYLVKPTKIFSIMIPISKQIKEMFLTNSSYHDVSASYDPSKYVDYDYRSYGAGKFSTPFNILKSLSDTLRDIYQGPVSSEGLAHFLYVGYYDDICAQIHTAKSLPGSYGTETLGGFYKPLFVNFDLIKMKDKATVHGVGYYERFFYKNNYWEYMGRSKDSILMYAATELAYGHGAFFSTFSSNIIEQGVIEYNYIYPMQLRYAESKIKLILYNDDGNLLSASDYIRKHPYTFDKFESNDFMSQVYLEYENGANVFINRNPYKKWQIDYSGYKGFYSMHSELNNKDTLFVGFANGFRVTLPYSNGWLCYSEK